MWFWSVLTFLTPTQHLCWITPEGSRFCGLWWAWRYAEFVSSAAIFLLHTDPMQKNKKWKIWNNMDRHIFDRPGSSPGFRRSVMHLFWEVITTAARLYSPSSVNNTLKHSYTLSQAEEKMLHVEWWWNLNLIDEHGVKNREIEDVKKSTWRLTVYLFDAWQLNWHARWLKGQGCF